MKNGRVAVPSDKGGGLKCLRSEHFGHCDSYTLVDLENGQITNNTVIENIGHEHGDCLVPVNLLAQNQVDAIIVAGIGRRPLAGFNEVNIDVYIDRVNPYVNKSVKELANDRLSKMTLDETCGGGGNCH